MLEQSEYFDKPDALLIAALIGDFDGARILLERGADPNQQDQWGQTAMMIAIQEGYGGRHWVDLLSEFGADFNLVDSDGDSALDLAIFHREAESAQILQEQGAIKKGGPCAKKVREDEIHQAFADANAVKRLVSLINRSKRP